MKFYLLDGNETTLCAVPSKDIISLYQNLNYHQADTLEGSLILDKKYIEILDKVRYFAISDRNSSHNFYLYRKTLVQVQNHEIAINGQGAFWDEMQGAYIKDRRPNKVTPADTIKLILSYSRWNVDFVDQLLEEEELERDMNFYYVSLLDALNTVYKTWQVDIEPYINIEGHQITRRYVKLYRQQGGNNGRRFVYGDNALTVTQQANEGSIFTALVGRGAGVEETDSSGNLTGGYSRKINFADIEWSKANGDPCDKPKGQEYVEWKESTALYGYSDGKPRIGIVDFENEKDPAQLLKDTWAQLQQVGVPLVQFQATVGDVGYLNLGETVTIVRYDLNIKYQTRVTGIKWNRCDEKKSQITIGVKAIQSTADKIASLQQSVAQANVNADAAVSTASHAIVSGSGAIVNYGPNEPSVSKEGDIWYDVQSDGTVVLKQYQNGQWVVLIDDTTGEQIKNKVAAQQKELDQAVKDASSASSKADSAVAQAGDANTNAQKAIATAEQNQEDLSLAKSQLSSVQTDLTSTKSSISQAQSDLKNTEQSLQEVQSDLTSAKRQMSDLTEQAQTQGQTIVNVQKTQSELSTSIADVKGDVSSLQQTTDSLKSTIADANNNISAIRQTADGIENKVSNMRVGGTNLLRNTKLMNGEYWYSQQNPIQSYYQGIGVIHVSSDWWNARYFYKSLVKDKITDNTNDVFTFSCLVKRSSKDSKGDISFFCNAVNVISTHIDQQAVNENYWTQIWVTFKFKPSSEVDSSNDYGNSMRFEQGETSGETLYTMFKLERGNVPTAYNPAPQDIDGDISTVSQKADSIESIVKSNSGDISSLKQTASSLQSILSTSNSDNLLYNSDFLANIPGKAPNTDWVPVDGWYSLNGTAVQRCNWYNLSALQVGWINANGGLYTQAIKCNLPTPPANPTEETDYNLSFLYGNAVGVYDFYIEASYTSDFSNPEEIKIGSISDQFNCWNGHGEFNFSVPTKYSWIRLKMVSEQDKGLMYLAQPMLVYGKSKPSSYISSNQPSQKMSSIKQTIDSIESTVQGNSGQISQLKQTANSLQSDIQNKTDISQFKQLSNGLQTVVEDIGTFLPDSDFSDADLSKYFDPWDTSTSLDPFRVITDDKEAGHYLQLHGINKTIQKIITKDYIKIVPTSDVIYSGQSLLWWPNDQPNGSFMAYLHFYDANKKELACNGYSYKYDQKSVWQDFSFTDTPPSDAMYLRIESTVDVSNSSDDIYGGLRKLKLQNGDGFFSKISQLSQTSDSLTSQISNANNDISQLKQTAGSLSSQIGNANNDISSLKQRADSMETNISNNQNDISSLKQTATSLQSNIQSKTDISQFTQLSNAFQTVVEDIGAFLPDSDFSDTDLSKYYDPWDTSTSLDPFKVITDDKQAGHYLQLHGISKTIQKIITKDYIRIIPTSDITYSGQSLLWWNDPLNGSFIAYLHFYNANKEELTGDACYYRYDQKSVWQDFSYTVTPPSDAMYLRIESTVDASNSSGDIYGGLRKLRLQNGDGFFSKISQLSDDINLRVQKGDLISQINIEAGKTLIQSKNLYLDSDTVTFSGRAFIPSAAITDLSADKITAGTLNAGNVNIINLDVNKLVGDTTEFVRSGWTNAYGSHVQIDGGGVNISYGNWYTRFDSSGIKFKDGSDYLGEVTRIGMNGAPSWYNGLAFNAGGDAEFLAFGAQDYGNDSQGQVPAKLLWMREGIDTYSFRPGWNFTDRVWADDIRLGHIGTSDYRLDLISLTVGNETAIGLQSGNGYGFWWGANGGLGIYGGGKYVNFTGTKFLNDIQMGQGGSASISSL